MSQHWLGELIKLCDIEDETIDKIQEKIQAIIDEPNKGKEETRYDLCDILITLDGLGCDVDRSKEIIKGMI